MINPKEDGIKHINVYSKGKTPLGRFLSNFERCDLETEDGYFASVEAYWYWLGCKDEKLRETWGYKAKQLGRSLGAKDWIDDKVFKKKICEAIRYKIMNNDDFLVEFIESSLPFAHYYVFESDRIAYSIVNENPEDKIVEPKEGKWIIAFLESFRKELKEARTKIK